ncbi:conserved Plasmodium protein, unknown function [Plasmodium malariae]|uniref:Uncharacterized protein n=1 Tax=Plasmodium malariae TaxID=5858 RepID=A0A1C3L0U6_PLAMA|nr:conserved Plasmodium protein, unknown function [Plasmodium malariae]SBT80160.1 conserved Plasmodium protein, unknown function [Plasmodium malariae]SCO93793.1 conserved Plasmodium protein, unknown function [Plasmodium malariae]
MLYERLLKSEGKGGVPKKNFLYLKQEKLICNQQTPLHIYNATKFSKKSMNHRLFYINWVFVFLFLDMCNSHLDI